MANDIKSGIGYIIPAAAVVGFFTTLLLGEYLLSIVIAVAGYFMVCIHACNGVFTPPNLGNLIIFLDITFTWHIHGFGVVQNMWGGIEFQTEGPYLHGNLFFSILTGMLFRNQTFFGQPLLQRRLNEPRKTMGTKGFKTK
ncbi:MAG: hypothetical protein Ct9H300mP2_1330 [Candidatus Neomarinimicrobiota bacterium]|nr:MAG: hypothetical protein Ct9H300mP2_1330 [Candidatus Neomarinimicrobiota bacterium]